MLDCGEGTFGQIYDHFQDEEKIDDLLINLKCILLTHFHGDHVIGTIDVLTRRDKAMKNRGV
jgi:ribonuclease BN (tRNA processing enzyme)